MNKNDIIQIEITDMTEDGRGVGRYDGMAVFVSGAVYGDTADVKITKVKKRYAEGFALEIREPSEHRIPAAVACPYIDECGGCAYGLLSEEAEEALKVRQIKEKLTRIGGVEEPTIRPMISLDSGDLEYRNKAVISVGFDDEGNPAVGFKARKSHKVVDCKECMLQLPPAINIADVVRNNLSYPGLCDSFTVRTAVATGEVMVIFDLAPETKGAPVEDERRRSFDWETMIYDMDDAISEPYSLESVVIRRGNNLEYIAGKKTIRDSICGLEFEISPESFYQVNSKLVESLYGKALEYAGLPRGEDKSAGGDRSAHNDEFAGGASGIRLLDAYCGVGTMGLIAASRGAKEVIGIEAVKSAILDANRNASINGIVNARFIRGKVEAILAGEEAALGNFDVVILDPPRSGCDESGLRALMESAPERIVYVSCDPGTLARDVKVLTSGGYRFVECTPVNMFKRTGHVEAVILLCRAEC